MSSAFAWLDFDDRTRRQILEVVDLFREKGTLDELGIGQIRDAFADRMFPGTSTIQTRARYFFFLSWIYQTLATVPSATPAANRAREMQNQLVKSLKAGGEQELAGVIGYNAGDALKRLPAAVYWNGLRRLGFRLVDASTEQYHAEIDRRTAGSRRRAVRGESEELLELERPDWFPSLPEPPAGWLQATNFDLTAREAAVFSERIQFMAPDTILAEWLMGTVTGSIQSRSVWDLDGLDRLSPELRRVVLDAENFSLVMHGAALTYNLLMARKAIELGMTRGDSWRQTYTDALERWAAEMRSKSDALTDLDWTRYWARIREMHPRVSSGAVLFCDTWMQRAVQSPETVGDDPQLVFLITQRERRLKGSLARLSNPRVLEKWSGASGAGRLDFRWANARIILRDIQMGLEASDA